MAYQFSLSDGINTVTSSSLASSPPELNVDQGQRIETAIDGTVYIILPFTKVYHEITVNNVSSTDAGYINTWKDAGTSLTYTPDTASAGTTYTAIIINDQHPLKQMSYLPTKYEGVLMIREV